MAIHSPLACKFGIAIDGQRPSRYSANAFSKGRTAIYQAICPNKKKWANIGLSPLYIRIFF